MTANRPWTAASLILIFALAPLVGHAANHSIDVNQPMLEDSPWTARFSIEPQTSDIIVTIRISLLLPTDANRLQLENSKAGWQEAIDKTWNNRFLVDVGDKYVPLLFKIEFTHINPHHRIIVDSGRATIDQHNWQSNTPGYVIAHEIGHMLGAYDEYRGGMHSPEQPIIDTTSIMGSRPESGVAYPHHLVLLNETLINNGRPSEIILVKPQ